MKYKLLALSTLISLNVNAEITLNKTGVFVDAKEGESTLIVTNSGKQSVLLHVEEIKEEAERLSGSSVFVLTPTISNLEPGGRQLIRVIMIDDSLEKQKISRLRIQEIPFSKNNKNQVMMSQSYNISALAHPKTLEINEKPWVNLKMKDNEIINETKYVVKILPNVFCLDEKNQKTLAKLSSSYALPNKKIKIISETNCESLEYKPVSNTGQIMDLQKISQK